MTDPQDTENLSPATIEADEEEAHAGHGADRAPTPDEEAAAPTEVDPSVGEHFAEAERIGVEVKGEGRI